MDARRTFIVYLTNAVGGLFGLVSLFFIGRYMDPVAYGVLGFALGYVGFVSILADLGLGQSHVRHVSIGGDLQACVRTFVFLKLAFLAVFLAGCGVALLVWANDPALRDASSWVVLLTVIVYFVLQVLRSIPLNTLTALKKTARTQFIVLAEHLGKLPLVIVVALVYGRAAFERVPFGGFFAELADLVHLASPPDPRQGGLLLAVAFLGAMAFSLLYSIRYAGTIGFAWGRVDRALLRSYVVMAVPAAIVVTLRVVFTQVDAVFVGYFLVAENVGYFFAADRLTSLILIVPTAIQLTFYPVLNELAARRGAEGVAPVARGLQRTLSLVLVLVTMFFVLYPREIIRIFMGAPFEPAAAAVRVMAVYIALLAFASTSSYVLMALGRVNVVAVAGLTAIFLNVALDIVLIPDRFLGIRMAGFHAAGAALASVVAQTVSLTILVLAARTRPGSMHLGRPTFMHVVAAVVAGVATHYLVQPVVFGENVRFWQLGIVFLSGTIAYVGTLVLVREVGRKDLVLMRQLLNPRELAAYIRSEFK